MEYSFLETSDEALIEGAKLPLEKGAAIGMFTTGYDVVNDETVAISIVDMNGSVLFSKKVKPHNREDWSACEASGGIGPEDVEEAQPLYELEDEMTEVLEPLEFVLCQHVDFVKAMLDRSWIAMPNRVVVDVCELFRLSHCVKGYPEEPATVATIESIAEYYGFVMDVSTTEGVARAVNNAYRSIVGEFVQQRDAKGQEYWDAYEARMAEENSEQNAARTVEQMRERRYTQMNALLWVAGGIIFTSLVIQLYQNGGDIGFMMIAGAAAAFCYIRAVINWNKK